MERERRAGNVRRREEFAGPVELARFFEPGRDYAEADVNLILGRVHRDFASLRRYLVDERFLTRDHGTYRRL